MDILKRIDKFCESLDWSRIEKSIEAQYKNAKREGSVKDGSKEYAIVFEPKEGIYIFTDEDGVEVYRANTRKINMAKKWFKEYMNS
jgi:hypothetical protein